MEKPPGSEAAVERMPERVYAKLTLLRHGETASPFSEGIAPGAEEHVREVADTLASQVSNEDVFVVNSPSTRAQETAAIATDRLEVGEESTRELKLLRAMLARDQEKLQELIERYYDEDDRQRTRLTRALLDPDVKELDDSSIVETREHIKARRTMSLRMALRFFDRYRNEHPGDNKIPHVFAVTHAELLTPLVHELFDVAEEQPGVDYSEPIECAFIEQEERGAHDGARARITFRGETVTVRINEDGSIEKLEEHERT